MDSKHFKNEIGYFGQISVKRFKCFEKSIKTTNTKLKVQSLNKYLCSTRFN